MHIINILSRFNRPEVKRRCTSQLRRSEQDDPFGRADRAVAHGRPDRRGSASCPLLRDPEIDVQNRAIDVLIRANDPGDDQAPDRRAEGRERIRAARRGRSAQRDRRREVGQVSARAIKDDDWWVRSRAGDALGKIGGPKVIDAVLQLVRDKDDEHPPRRDRDPEPDQGRARGQPPDRGDPDTDWWVSERAVDALAEIGSKSALPRLLEMLQTTAPAFAARRACVRSASSATIASIDALLPLLARPEKEIRVEAMHALATLSDERRAEQVRAAAAGAGPEDRPDDRAALPAAALNELANAARRRRLRARMASGADPGRAARAAAASMPRFGDRPHDELDSKPVLRQVEQPAPIAQARHHATCAAATSSKAATSTSSASARAPSAPCC